LWQTLLNVFNQIKSQSIIQIKPLAAGVVLSLAVGAGYLLQQIKEPAVTPIPCDLQLGKCEFETTTGVATLELTPTRVSSAAPFKLSVSYPGDAPTAVWVDLQGKEMYMGVNQPHLERQAELWSAEANLGVCTTGTMRWVLNLVVELQTKQQIYQFEFDAS
jgi:hypothetical protein